MRRPIHRRQQSYTTKSTSAAVVLARRDRLARWLGSGFFVALAVICVWIGLQLLILGNDEDTTRGVLIGVGVCFLLVAVGAAYGATWVFSRWPHGSRKGV
jgi:hypothetical protein